MWSSFDPTQKMPDLYQNVPIDGVLIPTTDEVAYKHFEDHRWVYNKLLVSESQWLPCGPVGTMPTEYPVCVKPIYNLFGGSIGSIVCHNKEEYNQVTNPGAFWSRYAFGEHYSIDVIMLNGEIMKWFVLRGEKLQHGAFDYWELVDLPKAETDYLSQWLYDNIYDYTGVINVEMIGCQIIEAQLRMGDIDRFGDPGLMRAIHQLYNEKVWNWAPGHATPDTFYLAALFAQPDVTYSLNKSLFNYICADLTYYQFDDPDFFFTNPAHGNRVAIFCDPDWDKVERARNIAANMIKPDIDGKYLQPLLGFQELTI